MLVGRVLLGAALFGGATAGALGTGWWACCAGFSYNSWRRGKGTGSADKGKGKGKGQGAGGAGRGRGQGAGQGGGHDGPALLEIPDYRTLGAVGYHRVRLPVDLPMFVPEEFDFVD